MRDEITDCIDVTLGWTQSKFEKKSKLNSPFTLADYHSHKHEHPPEYIEDQMKMVESKDHINPSHYKEIVPGYQYIEMMGYMLKDLDGYEGHLLGQAYKYMMRYGKKDNKAQEIKKSIWYLNKLVELLEEK